MNSFCFLLSAFLLSEFQLFPPAVDTAGEGMSRERLFQLAAQADEQLRHFYVGSDDDQNQQGVSAPRMAVRGAAAAGLGTAGYLAYQNRGAIAQAGKDVTKKGLKGVARGAGLLSEDLRKRALYGPSASAINQGGVVNKALWKGTNKAAGVANKLRAVAKDLTRADVDRIVMLAQRIENLVDFDDAPAPQQRGKVGMYLTGGPQALYNQDKFKKSGLVYRKRDAYVDGVKGGLTSYAAGGAAAAGAYGLGRAAVSGKLPKGIIRKGAVKAAQFMKKSPLGTMAAISAGATGARIAGVQHSANKRRKEQLKQRLEPATA